MAENKSGKELIEEAFELVLTGDETNMAVAVMLLKRAKDLHYNTSDYSIDQLELYIKFIETLLGLNSSKEEISKFFLKGITHSYNGRTHYYVDLEKLEVDGTKLQYINLGFYQQKFLENDLSEIWVKSLKYDGLVKQLKKWEDDDNLDSDRMKKIKEILGEK